MRPLVASAVPAVVELDALGTTRGVVPARVVHLELVADGRGRPRAHDVVLVQQPLGPFSKSRTGDAGSVSPLSCGSVASMKDAISAWELRTPAVKWVSSCATPSSRRTRRRAEPNRALISRHRAGVASTACTST